MKPFILGLTGSIGMGKSTTAALFREAGIPVWDADAVVHRLYANGIAAKALKPHFPEAVTGDLVSRETLKRLLSENPTQIETLDRLIHPLVAQDREDFLAQCESDLLVLDIPLLFEKNSEKLCDAVLVVTAPADIQRQRIVSRGTMSEAQLDLILSRQMPDREKRSRADHIVETLSIDGVRAYVAALIRYIRARSDA